MVFIQTQGEITRSSVEVEYRALALASVKVIWLQSSYAPILLTDSINVKYLVVNLIMRTRMKHVEVGFCFICDLVV